MRIALLFALALFVAAPVQATDLDDFLNRAVKLESQWQKPKPMCICMDGTELNARMGALSVDEFIDAGSFRVRVLCRVPRFSTSTRNYAGYASCSDYLVLAK